ncbi:HU family DNA-binding protein [Shimia sp.]|uniref:HU family DNA-binding protein n=1 Tax=Shimia sp. TaxID=1954381 RepID=UPI003567AD72
MARKSTGAASPAAPEPKPKPGRAKGDKRKSTRSGKAGGDDGAPEGAKEDAAASQAPSPIAPVVVTETAPQLTLPDLKKVDLVDQVVERSGIKKKFAKPAIEAALAVLGEALSEGRSLNLRPLGKLKVLRSKDVANGRVQTLRLRQPQVKPQVQTKDKEPLADPDEGR